MRELKDDCWICKSLHEPAHLIFFESRTSIAKLNPDQFFTGYSFVALKWHREELYQLRDTERKRFLEDMSTVARALSEVFRPDKMNYELLGNGMPHLHWHIIPRFKTDPFWGRPIWAGNRPRKRLDRADSERVVQTIRANLRNRKTSGESANSTT